MNLPLQISFHGMEPSQALEAAAAKKAHKLDELSADIMSCRVVIEQQQKHQHPVPRHGDVVRLDTEGRFGFIRTPDGDEYYFDRENLAGANFDQVQSGAEVQFLPEVGAEGRQAKRVSFGKHRFD